MMLSVDNVDFLPERIKAARARRRRIVREVYLLTLCAAALLTVGYARSGQVSQAKAELASVEARGADIQKQLAVRRSLEKQQADLMVIRLIENDLGSRVNTLDVLAELENVIPPTIALLNLDLETTEVRIPVDTTHKQAAARLALAGPVKKDRVVKRVELTIIGLSPTDIDVANFIGQLSASPLFEEVNMGYTRNEEFNGRHARKFQASCYIVR